MSSNSVNSQEGTKETGKSSSAWSAFSSKFQDFRQKAKSKGYELAGYANQQSRSIMSRIKKGIFFFFFFFYFLILYHINY